MGAEMVELENSSLKPDEKLAKKDALLQNYAVKSERVHTVNQLLKAHQPSVFMGIAVEHLKSVASIVGIPNTYIEEICRNQQYYRSFKDKGVLSELKKDTYLLLKAVYHKVLQTGEE